MSSSKTPNFKLKLTPEQQAMVRKATGKNAAAIELSVQELEQRAAKLLGVPYVVAAPSGSMALLMSALALCIGPGDEVIVPNYTWIASAHSALLLGAKIVLVDVLPDRHHAAKDLGVFNIAGALPFSIAPAMAPVAA